MSGSGCLELLYFSLQEANDLLQNMLPQGSDSWVVELALWNILFQSGWYPILSLSSFPFQSSFLSPLWALWLLFRTDLWSINNIKTNYLIWKDKILVEERIHTEWPAFIDKCQFRGYWDCNFLYQKIKKIPSQGNWNWSKFQKISKSHWSPFSPGIQCSLAILISCETSAMWVDSWCLGISVILDTNRWFHQTDIIGEEMSITIGSEYD